MMGEFVQTAPDFGLLVTVSSLVLQPFCFAVPTYLLARKQPRKDGFRLRVAAALTVLLVYNALASTAVWWGIAQQGADNIGYLLNFVIYSLYLVILVVCVLICFDTSIWNALFCATAGYTIQNLGSGMGELARIALQMGMGIESSIELSTFTSNIGIAIVIVAEYLLFIRRVDNIGRLGDDSRNMFAMLFLVILGVIAFDVLVRGLEREGANLGFMAALRVVHFAVSNFILYAEYETLYNARLRAEVTTQELLATERERQYQLSRDTIAAVNRRVHDIRHKVFADLAEGDAQVSREVLSSVTHDISVFDTQVKTGNDVLDTILTEKSLLCARRDVTLSCIADGTALSSLPTTDLYALFGGLLDGAIDAVCELDNKRERSISLTVRRVGDLALLHLERYGPRGDDAAFAAARDIVERHGGTLTVSSGGESTVVDVMLSAE